MTAAQNLGIVISLVLVFSPMGALAQSGTGLPLSDAAQSFSTKELTQMNPEELEAAVEEMIVNYGVSIGLDEAELRAASPAERDEMFEQAAMSEEEFYALMAEQQRGSAVDEPPLPLLPAMASGFPDGSIGIPVGSDMIASIEISGSPDSPMILVVVDGHKKRLLWRKDVTLPFQDTTALSDLDAEPAHVVIELINPATGRVEQRFRPVSAPENASSQ